MTIISGSKESLLAEDVLLHLIQEMKPTAQQILARYRIPRQDAEDLLQQTWLAYLGKHEEVRRPEAWICGTLRKLCLLYWRKRRRSLWETVDNVILETLVEPAAPDQEQTELRSDLEGVLKELSRPCRSVLRLRYRLGCRPRETADRLGYSAASIYKITERCLAALSRRLLIGGFPAPRRGPAPRRTEEGRLATVKKCRPDRRRLLARPG